MKSLYHTKLPDERGYLPKFMIPISIVTPSVRPEFLEIVKKCLNRQTHADFEWLVCSPFKYEESDVWLKDRPKKEDELYCLNKAFNDLFKMAKGELIISIVDGIYFPPDTLERFWNHYQTNPKALISAIGHQYDQIIDGKPEHLVWQDPRPNVLQGSFCKVKPSEIELCVASLPKKAVLDCGGMDEIYDRGSAVGEKEMCWRLEKLGYEFFIDTSIEYRAIHHPRLTADWDEWYEKSSAIFIRHMTNLEAGKRTLNVGFVK